MNNENNRVARNKELADALEKYLNEYGTKEFYENPEPILKKIGFVVDENQLKIIREQLDKEKESVEYLTAPTALRVIFYVM